MYDPNSARVLKIGIIEENPTSFQNIFNENILSGITIHKKFILETTIINIPTTYSKYNFIFYLTSIDQLNTEESAAVHIKNITAICATFTEIKNHLFVIVDSDVLMETDDDGDLIFADEDLNANFNRFTKQVDSKLVDVSRLSTSIAKIFLRIIEDSSIVNLSPEDIDTMAKIYVKKASKMSAVDKKRELKTVLKKLDLETKLAETAYTELSDTINKYFKLVYQKKIICKNYLCVVDEFVINMSLQDPQPSVLNLKTILDEICAITYLKEDMFNSMMEKVQAILKTKFEIFCNKMRPNIAIDSTLLSSIDAYKYHDFLLAFLEIDCIKNKFIGIKAIIEKEVETINKMIVDHYNKEVGKIIDLDKISVAFKVFAAKDKTNIPHLFQKMRSNPQIINENIDQMDKWISFIDTCIKLEIDSTSVIELLEHVIIEKIKYNIKNSGDMSRLNQSATTNLYLHCLLTFVTKNLSVHFVFEKLYMCVMCGLRFLSRNTFETIQNLTVDRYNLLLVLENKLLEIIRSQ